MSDWQAEKIREWRMRLNMACYHNRLLHVTLRPLPDEPFSGYVKLPIHEDGYLVNFSVLAGEDSTVVVTFSLDDLLTVSREVPTHSAESEEGKTG